MTRFPATALAVLMFLCGGAASAAETLYAASVRGPLNDPGQMTAGNLYAVDVPTGVFTLVGPIRVNGTAPIGVTGLADHPTTGVLYGVTAELSPNHPGTLVTIDARNGDATVVGSLGIAVTDIAFDAAGQLLGWLPRTSQVGRIDVGTGTVTPLGQRGAAGETGGIAIDTRGTAYVASTGATGTLDRYDLRTGAATRGPELKGAPYPAGINSLTISPGGAIFAVNTNLGSPANTLLVRIDPASGAITQLGPLPNDTDALVFAQAQSGFSASLSAREWAILAALLVAIVLALGFYLSSRRR